MNFMIKFYGMNIKKKVSKIPMAAVLLTIMAGMSWVSCSKWTEIEAESYYDQFRKEDYHQNIRDYLNSPHRIVYGWFGNWTGRGSGGRIGEGTLMGLPDSVDFVSLWLVWDNFNEARLADLREYQAAGHRAVLCWRAGRIGDNLTPAEYKDNPGEYWGWSIDGEDWEGNPYTANSVEAHKYAAEKYAMAVVDTCRKYNIDGFDYDIEDNSSGPGGMWQRTYGFPGNYFLLKLADEFDKDGRITMCDIPGATWGAQGATEAYYKSLTSEVILRLQYIAWQTYEKSNLDSEIRSILSTSNGHSEEAAKHALKISIFTGDFEDANKTPYLMPQVEWGRSNIDKYGYAGHGVYHIEKDFSYKDPDFKGDYQTDYPRVRKIINILNPPVLPE